MPVHFGYTDTIFGTQSTVNGSAHNYAFAVPTGGTWRYSGPDTYFVVNEADGATQYNGDPTNETVSAQEQIGGAFPQTVTIAGTERQTIWDYTFTVTDGTTTWRVGVIDVDLNNDDDLNDASEDGYILVFPDGMPPADTNLTAGGIVENDAATPHLGLGASVVCFAAGMEIDTPNGPIPVENLQAGDLVETRDHGPQPIRWIGSTTTVATDKNAPIIITAGTLSNTQDMTLSPLHAVLLTDWRAELLFGEEEILVRACDLLNHDGVHRSRGGNVTYYHILLDQHEMLRCYGQWSESLYPGDITRGAVEPMAQAEIETLFPKVQDYGPKNVTCIRKYEAACLTDQI